MPHRRALADSIVFASRKSTVSPVTEPMGMVTLIYLTLDGAQIWGRLNPNGGAPDGGPLRLAVDLNNMHLLNEATGTVP
jgi:multiple sugar transport system ATP-binding protein